MIINFNGDISKQEVQEMINSAVDFNTGVLNLSYATSGQVQEALADPTRWLFSIDYSGATYLEHHRRETTGSTIVHFYVLGAEPSGWRYGILDKTLYAQINKSTYAITTGSNDYAPDIIYNLSKMSVEQLKVLAKRGRAQAPNGLRFGAVWTYNDYNYVCSAKFPDYPNYLYLLGTAADFGSGFPPTVHYDVVEIDSDGNISHTEYDSNITLTPAQ